MKIRCYDKYNKHWLIIKPVDDHINVDGFSSNRATGQIGLSFECDKTQKQHCEDPHPERWSDLEKFELIE